jgi:hypothetical protein
VLAYDVTLDCSTREYFIGKIWSIISLCICALAMLLLTFILFRHRRFILERFTDESPCELQCPCYYHTMKSYLLKEPSAYRLLFEVKMLIISDLKIMLNLFVYF